MKRYIDLDSLSFIRALGFTSILSRREAKRRDSQSFSFFFVQNNKVVELPDETYFVYGVKADGDFSGPKLVEAIDVEFSKVGSGVDTHYDVSPNFNTRQLNDLFVDGLIGERVVDRGSRFSLTGLSADYIVAEDSTSTYWQVVDGSNLDNDLGWRRAPEKESVSVIEELEWVEPGVIVNSTKTILVNVFNDVNQGGEGDPIDAAPGLYNKNEVDSLFQARSERNVANGYLGTNSNNQINPEHIPNYNKIEGGTIV